MGFFIKAIAAEEGGRRGERVQRLYKEMRKILPPEEVAIMLDGTGGVTMGQIFKRYDENIHTYRGLGPEGFIALRDKGYGDFWCGMDHGGAHPTVVVYVFIATHPAPSLQLVEGDYVQVWEYYKAGSSVPSHIPRLKALHEKFKPKAYFCDPHMWDDDAKQPGRTVARDYGEAGIRPMYRGNNQVDPGIQAVDRLLMPRAGDFPWPRFRLVARCNQHTEDGFRIWSTKPDAMERSGSDKYSEVEKDTMDAVRYLVRAAPERHAHIAQMPPVAVDGATGVPLDMFCALDAVGAALI